MNRRTFLRNLAGAAAAVPLVAAGAAAAKQSWSLGYIARQDGTLECVSIAPMPPAAGPPWPPRHPNCRCILAPIN